MSAWAARRDAALAAVMMPTISAAYQDLTDDQVSRAAPTLSAIQQVGASLGSALLVTALIQRLTHQFTDHGIHIAAGAGAGQLSSIPPDVLPVVGPFLADSFGFAFWVAFCLTSLIFIPALFLPRHRTQAGGDVMPATAL